MFDNDMVYRGKKELFHEVYQQGNELKDFENSQQLFQHYVKFLGRLFYQ